MDIVKIHGTEWRYADVAEEIEWCRNRTWIQATYDRPDDHSHCQICWWTLARSDARDTGEGYVSEGKLNVWLCTECYEQFIAQQALAADARKPSRD